MPKAEFDIHDGQVAEILTGGLFRVQLASNHLVLAYVANRAKRELRHLRVGEHVRLEMSPYDPDRARFTARLAEPH